MGVVRLDEDPTTHPDGDDWDAFYDDVDDYRDIQQESHMRHPEWVPDLTAGAG